MNHVSALYQRFRQLIREGAKFAVVGFTGAVITLGGADILHFDAGLGKYSAITVTTIIATVVTFLGNRYWTFRHRQGKGAPRESVMFFILNGVGLLIQYGSIWLVVDALSLQGRAWYTVANFLGLVIGTVFRFWSYRKWVWRAKPAVVAMAASASATAPAEGLPEPSRNGHEHREPELVPPLRPQQVPVAQDRSANGRPASHRRRLSALPRGSFGTAGSGAFRSAVI